jgi:hypothetical protein
MAPSYERPPTGPRSHPQVVDGASRLWRNHEAADASIDGSGDGSGITPLGKWSL